MSRDIEVIVVIELEDHVSSNQLTGTVKEVLLEAHQQALSTRASIAYGTTSYLRGHLNVKSVRLTGRNR